MSGYFLQCGPIFQEIILKFNLITTKKADFQHIENQLFLFIKDHLYSIYNGQNHGGFAYVGPISVIA